MKAVKREYFVKYYIGEQLHVLKVIATSEQKAIRTAQIWENNDNLNISFVEIGYQI